MSKELSNLGREIAAIIDIVKAPGSVPDGIMNANKMNSGLEWDEEANAAGFDASALEVVASYERAVKLLVKRANKHTS